MKQRHMWLLALLSVLILTVAGTQAIAQEGLASGHVEVGLTAVDTDDNPARVNEYVKTSNDDSAFNPSLDLDMDYLNGGFASELGIDFKSADTYDLSLKADLQRILRVQADLQSFMHWKDHETLGQMGATLAYDARGGQPNVTTDQIFADLYDLGVTTVGGHDPIAGTYDPEVAYEQELDNDYIITRREMSGEFDMSLPQLPNVTFHAGLRVEEREGLEQAIGEGKCSGCHVSAEGKSINERTEDVTLGVTGKFGLVTVDYEYLNRNFDSNSSNISRYYSKSDKFDQLLYKGSELDYSSTPDSEKDTHSLKVRADFNAYTNLIGSYVKSTVTSNKANVEDSGYTLDDDTLKTEYESYSAKLSTRLGNWRFSLRGSTYEIDADDNEVTFPARAAFDYYTAGNIIYDLGLSDEWLSAEERETTEFGLDAVYRINKGTTLRLGYNYENEKRKEEELGETETHTYKVALKSRINSMLSGRISYQYQDIDDPFGADHATGIYQERTDLDSVFYDTVYDSGLWYRAFNVAGLDYSDITASKLFYWDVVYPYRSFAATNQPDTTHETKFNMTWAPSANMAANVFARMRFEENDEVHYDQSTYVPGFSFWWAPSNKLNLTMAYTFTKQDTENRACVGWYHG